MRKSGLVIGGVVGLIVGVVASIFLWGIVALAIGVVVGVKTATAVESNSRKQIDS